MRAIKLFLVGAAAMLLSACAATKPIPLDRAQAEHIKTIGIVTPDIPQKATSFVAATPGQSFGLLGALIDAGIQASRESALEASLKTLQFSADKVFSEKLAEAVKAQGYSVVMVPASRSEKGEFLAKYPTGGNVDAYLDVVATDYGYLAAGTQAAAPFRPYMYLKCRLVRADNAAVLMKDQVAYNPLNSPKDIVSISPDPAFAFATSDMMDSQPENVAEGLRVAFRQSATTVGTLLR
ncbi:MAG: hypothetical protein NVV74_07940 [Magnetospirillum sp.]|nr:hypothetical protein [Magnetospirillum sp.]